MTEKAFCLYDGFYAEYVKNNEIFNMPVQHYHDSYELYLQLDGKRYLFLDNDTFDLRAGDMVLLEPYEIHLMESRDSLFYERYVINFRTSDLNAILSPEEINMLLGSLKSCVVHLDDDMFRTAGTYFADSMKAHSSGGFLADKTIAASIMRLMLMMKQLSSEKQPTGGSCVDSEIIKSLHYINTNFDKEISLDELAELAHMSKYHFCRLFHSTTGAAPFEYLRNVRLAKVHKLLVNSDLPLSAIAEKSGFPSTARMTYTFRKIYNTSPREFRKKLCKKI